MYWSEAVTPGVVSIWVTDGDLIIITQWFIISTTKSCKGSGLIHDDLFWGGLYYCTGGPQGIHILSKSPRCLLYGTTWILKMFSSNVSIHINVWYAYRTVDLQKVQNVQMRCCFYITKQYFFFVIHTDFHYFCCNSGIT